MISLRCVKEYCNGDITKIENYKEAINSPLKYVCHHKREIQCGYQIWSKEELIRIGQYYKVNPEELILLPISEHIKMHNNAIDPKRKCQRKVMTEEQKKILSEKSKGKTPWNKGLKGVQTWSEDSKNKLKTTLSKPEIKTKIYTEERNNKIRNSRKGKHYPRIRSEYGC